MFFCGYHTNYLQISKSASVEHSYALLHPDKSLIFLSSLDNQTST